MKKQGIDWETILLGEEGWSFIPEEILRVIVMFTMVMVSLRWMGKMATMQGVFEVALIIALGSAAGDAMFYSKVGLVPAILVFAVIILMYKLMTRLMSKSEWFEHIVEGTHVPLIVDGQLELKALKEQELGKIEIFSDMRLADVSQLGQIKKAYIEPSGKISLFFYPDDEVKHGLPVLPELLQSKSKIVPANGIYACFYCGHATELNEGSRFKCARCHYDWCVKANDSLRVK